MGERTGLGPLELAVLRAVEAAGRSADGFRRTPRVLQHLDEAEAIGPDYALPVLRDLGAPWRVHLRLLDLRGNWGSVLGGPMADPAYTEVRLSPLGRLALASEDGQVGPVPIALVEGSAYRGGGVPPFAPDAVVAALRALLEADDPAAVHGSVLTRLVGAPVLPTGGEVRLRLASLHAGRRVRGQMTCRIERTLSPAGKAVELAVTGTPLGADVDEIAYNLLDRSRGLPGQRLAPPGPVLDVTDETDRSGVRVAVTAGADVDAGALEEWMRSVWPVTLEVDWRLPESTPARVRRWAAAITREPTGLEEFRACIGLDPSH